MQRPTVSEEQGYIFHISREGYKGTKVCTYLGIIIISKLFLLIFKFLVFFITFSLSLSRLFLFPFLSPFLLLCFPRHNTNNVTYMLWIRG
jgi:hypothetical protein